MSAIPRWLVWRWPCELGIDVPLFLKLRVHVTLELEGWRVASTKFWRVMDGRILNF